MGYLTTSQLQRIHNLGGLRNAQRIIKDLDQYLCSTRIDGINEKVHYLSKKGREWISSKKERKFTSFIPHFILRNQYFIHNRIEWRHWFPEQPKLKIDEDKTLIPDAFCKVDGQWVFLEIDREQDMKKNEKKIEMYLECREKGKFPSKQYGGFPKVVFVTTTEYRQKRLRSMMNKLKHDVLLDKDLY